MTNKPKPATADRSRSIVFAVAAATLVLAAVLAVTLSSDGADAPAKQAGGVTEPVESAPVERTGEPLPPLAEGADGAIGRVAPVVTGVSFDGSPMSIGGAGERATLIAFGAHWCPHCQEEFPKLAEWAKAGTELRVVAVATATTDDRTNYPPSAWLQGVGWPGDVLVDDADSSAAVAYGVSAFPFLVLLDADGTVLARHAGGDVDFDAFVAAAR